VTIPDDGPTAGATSRWRDVDGIVLLDKPTGMGSTPALQRVRRLLRAAKAGHAGTLDPMATGMLPLCFGQATKACGWLLGSAKVYRARLLLGAATDTGDADGSMVRRCDVPSLERAAVASALSRFVGPRQQRPPMYSALKHRGQPLYELARRGEEIERAPRPIVIRRLELIDLAPTALEFEVSCSKGTYVRVLGEEIAAALGTVGHLGALRRLEVEPFSAQDMVSMATVEDWLEKGGEAGPRPDWLLPVDAAFAGLPRIDLDEGQSLRLTQGQTVEVAATPDRGLGRVYDPGGRFLGLVEASSPRAIRVARLFVPGRGGNAAPAQS
jgi:tRNA pseudouridine55 synthase